MPGLLYPSHERGVVILADTPNPKEDVFVDKLPKKGLTLELHAIIKTEGRQRFRDRHSGRHLVGWAQI